MSPKAKITEEMILEAAFEVARSEGAENINARAVARRLGCSTQPVMYHFEKIEDLKRAVYAKVDRLHTEYLMNIRPGEDVLSGIGLNYIRFAVEEPKLFCFLFQSGFVAENSVPQMMDSGELTPVLLAMQGAMGFTMEKTKRIFLTLSLFTHGYASLIANNGFAYDEKTVKVHLENVFRGAVLAEQEEAK